ncbi:hypothetical protein Aduo_006162 [Ancylostoma duodenale]
MTILRLAVLKDRCGVVIDRQFESRSDRGDRVERSHTRQTAQGSKAKRKSLKYDQIHLVSDMADGMEQELSRILAKDESNDNRIEQVEQRIVALSSQIQQMAEINARQVILATVRVSDELFPLSS